MGFPYYTGRAGPRDNGAAAQIPASRRAEQTRPEAYLADAGLVDAVNVALLLGQPLLLTGEPGTGKTQLAYSLAWELRLDAPLRFDTKSTSTATDLFYTYNVLGHFHSVQTGASSNALNFLTYNALGIAILRANDEADVRAYLPENFRHGGRRRSVVLIDEVDKAPRDFPNDLLHEVESMYFRVPELDNAVIQADPAMHPVLVLTSNSEKNLPDAFLRRCVFYHIPFPGRNRLTEIVAARLGQFAGGTEDGFLSDALDIFERLREPAVGLRKKPATSELLSWLVALREVAPGVENPLADAPDSALRTISTLIKTVDDQDPAAAVLRRWREERLR